MSGVQLLPTAEYLAQSQRADSVEFDYAMNYSFWPWRALTLIAPDLFGNPAEGNYWGYATYWEDAIYIGLLPFLLALGALRSSRRGDRKDSDLDDADQPLLPAHQSGLSIFLLVTIAITFILAMGKNTPVFPWLYDHVPTFNLFQAPARMMIWVVFSLSLLAGIGAENWRRPQKRALYWTRLGTAGAVAVSLGAGIAWYVMGDISPSFIRATALAGLWGVLAGGLSLVAPEVGFFDGVNGGFDPKTLHGINSKQYPYRLWYWGVVLLIGLDLWVAHYGLNPAVDLEFYKVSPSADKVRTLLDGGRLYLPESHEYEVKFLRYLRFDSFDPGVDWHDLRGTLLPNLPLLDNLSSANNFDPLQPGRYSRWLAELKLADVVTRDRMLDLMVVAVRQKVDQRQPYGVRYEAVGRGARLRWLPCALVVKDGSEALVALMDHEFDFQSWVIIEGDIIQNQAECPTEQNDRDVEIEIISEDANRILLKVSADVDGWLVLSDTWYPGWKAQIDGNPAQVYRAFYLFRAVPIEAGIRQIELVYQPISFWLGAFLSIGAWVVFIILRLKVTARPEGIGGAFFGGFAPKNTPPHTPTRES